MKRTSSFILFLLVLAGTAGYLLSKASLVGRVGITLFYKQYSFLKLWWQGGFLVFAVWMVLFFLQGRVRQKSAPAVSRWVHRGAIILALIGLYFTWQDFRHTATHRWLGQRFHWGACLFWLGWICISVFYLTRLKKNGSLPGLPLAGG